MKAVKCLKFQLHLANDDKKRILKLFDRYYLAKKYILDVVRLSPARLEILRMMYGSRRNKTIRPVFDRIKEKLREIIGDDVRSEIIDPCLFRFYAKSIYATIRECSRIPENVSSNVIYLAMSTHKDIMKRIHRNVTLKLEGNMVVAELRIFKKSIIRGTIGRIDVIGSRFPELLDAIRGLNGYKLGNPCQLVRFEDRLFLYIPIDKEVEVKDWGGNIMGIDLGISEYLVYYTIIDREGNVIVKGGIPSEPLIELYKKYDKEIRKRMQNIRGQRKDKRIFELLKRAYMWYHSVEQYPSKKELLRNIDHEFLSWFTDTFGISVEDAIRAIRRKRNRIKEACPAYRRYWKGLLNKVYSTSKIAPRSALGEPLWQVMSRELAYNTVNQLIELAKRYNVSIIAVERLKWLKSRITRRLRKEIKELADKYRKDRSESTLYKLRLLREQLKAVSRFPYRRLLEDLRVEAIWNEIIFMKVSAKGTSITCPKCGYSNRANRVSRSEFKCRRCGYTEHADYVASLNIALRALERLKGRRPHQKIKRNRIKEETTPPEQKTEEIPQTSILYWLHHQNTP